MTCANFQDLEAGLGASNVLTISPIDFPFSKDSELRFDIFNYQDQTWVNVPLATGATINVEGDGDVFYAWEVFDNDGQRAVRTFQATDSTTPALPSGGTASNPLAPKANTSYPKSGSTLVNVRLYRQTSINQGDLPAQFYPGSSITAEALNENFEAVRRVVEEGACSTNNVSEAIPLLDERYWSKIGTDTITSSDTWSSSDNFIATTAAVNKRINDGGGSGGFHSYLVWEKDSSNENLYKATKIQLKADEDPKKIGETEIKDGILQVLIEAGVYDVSSTSPSLKWDQKAQEFTLVIKNPSSETKFIDAVKNTLKDTTRFESDLSKYSQDPSSPTWKSGETTTIKYTVPSDKSFITPGSTTLSGGDAKATFQFEYNDDTTADEETTLTIKWSDAGSNMSYSASDLGSKTFLKMYTELPFSVTISGLSDNDNASSVLSSTADDDKFQDSGGTDITAAKKGAFSGKIVFDPKLQKDSTIPTITKTTTFTRDKGITGTADDVSVEDKDEAKPNITWTYPSFYLLTALGTDPTNAACVDDSTTTGFKSTVTNLGLLGSKVNNNGTNGKEFEVTEKQQVWFAVSDDVDRPNKVQTKVGDDFENVSTINVVEDVEIKPTDTSGFPGTYTAEKYNFVGCIISPGKTIVKWFKS